MIFNQLIYILIFIALLGVPFFVFYKIRSYSKGFSGIVLSVTISFIVMSGPIIAQWFAYNYYLENKVTLLDRDGDGFWSNEEMATWTASEQHVMDTYFNDGGRNVGAIIIFPAFAFIYSLITVSIYWITVIFRTSRITITAH